MAEHCFTARLSLEEGKAGVQDVTDPLRRQQTVEILAEWIQNDPTLLGDIEAHYRKIKEVGKRLLGRKPK